MTDLEKAPLSENIGWYEAGDYLVSAAIWRGIMGTSFEIGIRHKNNGDFWLLQSSKYNYQTVQEMANVVATLLSDKTQCYSPEWCKEMLCP